MKKIILSLICILLLTSCKNDEGKQYEEMAKKNVINYIQNKYNFTPEIVSVDALIKNTDPIPNFNKEYSGCVEITLNYNNNEFLAYITGEEESSEGFDNYQQEEILKEILEYMETYNGPHHSYEYSYNGYKCGYLEQESYIYENIYYDGNNIKDFVDNIKLRVDYIQNSNLNNLNNNITSLFDKGILSIYNFKNIDLYEEYSELFMPYTVQDNRISKYVDDAYYLINGRIVTSDKNS